MPRRFRCAYQLAFPPVHPAYASANDVTLQVNPQGKFLVIHGVHAESAEAALDTGRELAERFLDVLYRDFDMLLFLNTTSTGHVLIDETDEQDNTVGIGLTAGYGIMMYPTGQKPHAPISDLSGTHALRFLRKAAISQEWYDKFRNFYLVLEYVGSRLWWDHFSRRWASERELIQFAIVQAFENKVEQLLGFAQDTLSLARAAVSFEEAANFLVVKQRNAINHAHVRRTKKGTRFSLRVPFSKEDESAVKLTIPLVSEIAHRLVRIEKARLDTLSDTGQTGGLL